MEKDGQAHRQSGRGPGMRAAVQASSVIGCLQGSGLCRRTDVIIIRAFFFVGLLARTATATLTARKPTMAIQKKVPTPRAPPEPVRC